MDSLGLSVNNKIAEGNTGKELYNLMEGKASNHNIEVWLLHKQNEDINHSLFLYIVYLLFSSYYFKDLLQINRKEHGQNV